MRIARRFPGLLTRVVFWLLIFGFLVALRIFRDQIGKENYESILLVSLLLIWFAVTVWVVVEAIAQRRRRR